MRQRIAAGRAKHRSEAEPLLRSSAKPVPLERLMGDLGRLLTAGDIVVSDASYASIWTTSHLTALRPGMRFLAPRGVAGLGWVSPRRTGASSVWWVMAASPMHQPPASSRNGLSS